jgi:hypothetical protein
MRFGPFDPAPQLVELLASPSAVAPDYKFVVAIGLHSARRPHDNPRARDVAAFGRLRRATVLEARG